MVPLRANDGRGRPSLHGPWLRGHHLCRPALHECSEAIERFREVVSGCSESQAEMRRYVEAIAGCEQDSLLGGRLAKGSCIFAARQPRKSSHAPWRRNPAQDVAM